jgi:hypothetical protein
MSTPESPIPPHVVSGMNESLAKLVSATQDSAVATLTAAIVTARGKPISISDALAIAHDLHMAMFPPHGSATYKEWAKTKDQKLAKVQD